MALDTNATNAAADAAARAPIAEAEIDDQFADVRQEMNTRFALLPEQLQKVIMGNDYEQTLLAVAKAHKLTFDELGTLELETTMVLLGMTQPADYRDELQGELKKNDDEIDPLVKDVNEKVFGPVRAALERIYANQKEPEDYLKAAPAATAAATPAPIAAAPAASSPMSSYTPPSAPIPARATPAMPAAPTTTFAAPGGAASPFTVAATIKPVPAAFDATKNTTLSPAEKSTLERTGVILNDASPAARPSAAAMTSAQPSASMPKRADLLQGIENPPKAPSLSLDAFSSPVKSAPSKTTDYSLPKAGATPPPSAPAANASGDPYREPIA